MPDHAVADVVTPRGLLLSLARPLLRSLLVGMSAGVLGIVAVALVPLATGRAIDDGVIPRDTGAILYWAMVILALILIRAAATVIQERRDVAVTVRSSYRTMELVNEHAARLGSTLQRSISSGDLISIGVGDITPIGTALAATSRGLGAVVSIGVVAVIMLVAAWQLGLIVLVGVPIIVFLISRALRPFQARQRELRKRQGELTSVAVDIAAGLRIISGLGAQRRFSEQYRERSQETRRFATLTGRYQGVVSASRVMLSGLLTTVVVWVGARFVLDGRITPGQLVAFYGYAVFLVTPLRWLTDTAEFFTRGWVSLERAAGFLSVSRPAIPSGVRPMPDRFDLLDPDSGLYIESGLLTAVVCSSNRDSAELADRFAAFDSTQVLLDGHPIGDYDAEKFRRGVLVVPSDDYLFGGRLSTVLDPLRRASPDTVARYAHAASVDDVIDALEGGFEAQTRSGGSSFSGGERQRLRLLRALLAEPAVLLLLDPTSALDATTEGQVAERLKRIRGGRATVVFTTSPLVIGHADRICLLEDRRVIASGSHDELLGHDGYRRMVSRTADLP